MPKEKNSTPKILQLMRKALTKKVPTTVTIHCDSAEAAIAITTEVRRWDGVVDCLVVPTKDS